MRIILKAHINDIFLNDIYTDEASLISTTCKCENGKITCKPQSFTRKRCTVSGDPHFRTFDDIKYDFQGSDSYRLLGTDNIEINSNFAPCE